RGTAVSGIEATALRYGSSIDAETIDDLGTITIDPTGWYNGVETYSTLYVYGEDGDSVDFGGLEIGEGQVLNIQSLGLDTGEGFTLDFSGASGAGRISYQGQYYVSETVIGGALTEALHGSGPSNGYADTISYQNSTSGVTIDLRSQTVGGGDAEGDTIESFENAIGSQGNDVFTSGAGNNVFDGQGGDDVVVFSGNRASYVISTAGNITTVADSRTGAAADGTDSVLNVEVLRFADQDVQIGGPATLIGISGAPAVSEGDSGTTAFSFTLTRSGITTGVSSVAWAVTGGTANAADFGGSLPSGTVTFAAGQTVRTITLQVSGDTVQEEDETFTVTLSNPTGAALNTTSATGTILNDDNAPPVAVDDSAAVTAGESVLIQVLANDTDAEGNTLSVSAVTQPAHGSAWIEGTAVRYQAGNLAALSEGEVATETFTYTVSDGEDTDTATVTVEVTGVNDRPTLYVPTAAAAEDGAAITIDLASFGADPDNDDDGASLTYTLVSAPAGTSAGIAGTILTFDPQDAFQSAGRFHTPTAVVVVDVTDSHGATGRHTISIAMSGANDAPVITSAATATVAEGTTDALTVTATDPDLGDTITYAISGGADAALFEIDSATGALAFRAAPVFSAPGDADGDNLYDVEVSASDGLLTATQAARIAVTGTTLVSASVSAVATAEGDSGTHLVTFTLTRAGATTDAVTATLLASGTATAGSDYSGSIPATLTIAAGAASASFTVAILGDTLEEADETLGLTVTALSRADHAIAAGAASVTHTIVNDDANSAPVVINDSYATGHGTALVISAAAGVLSNDSDADGDPLSATVVSNPAHGALTLNTDGSFTYTPEAGFSGSDSFAYAAADGQGNSTGGTVTIAVAQPANRLPTAVADSYTLAEDGSLSIAAAAGVLANDSDPDGDPLVASPLTGPAHGTLSLNANGSFTYKPVADFNGTDSFTYSVSDGRGGVATATATLTVTAVNDAPRAAGDSFAGTEDTALVIPGPGVLANDSDVDGDPLTAIVGTGPAHGTLTLNGDGSFIYTPEADFNGTDGFTYRASDGQADSTLVSVALQIGAVNDAPTAVADSYATAHETPLTIAAGAGVLANDGDVDGDALSVSLGTDVSHGTLSLGSDGSFTYTPDADFVGSDSFSYILSDGTITDTATVTLSVGAPDNAAPVAGNDSYSVVAGAVLEIAGPGVLANDSDPDGDPLSVAGFGAAAHGTLTLGADGALRYVADAGFAGTETIAYQVTDGALTGSATITIEVTAPPVLTLTGTMGNDRLIGTDADEIIDPLGGRLDVMAGGGGADVFSFASSVANGQRETRTILDFTAGEDLIDLGEAAITGTRTVSAGTYLYLDHDMDMILLSGVRDFHPDYLA
ncbi:beta strand repeat-containing protein, partial [Frigidibacter sp. MR17.24]|uniref:beta strand repeat-containing protein n=1 Tax=Frigidibacter sp. MR17.24 TaxID=3127345 RepID=UPI003012CBE6